MRGAELQSAAEGFPELDDTPQEECGVVAFLSFTEDARWLCYTGGLTVQHRGEDAAGIAVSNGERISGIINEGTVPEVFAGAGNLEGLSEAHIGMAHVRYTTDNSEIKDTISAIMPFVFEDFAFGMNGQLTNIGALTRRYNIVSEGETDSKVLSHIINQQKQELGSTEAALEEILPHLSGAFSGVIMEHERIVVFRDRRGFRPLSIGRLADGGYGVASESAVYQVIGGEFDHHVQPGSYEIITKQGVMAQQWHEPIPSICGMEFAYFSRPDSEIDGVEVGGARERMGQFLAEDHPVDADVVIPIPDSGRQAATGLAEAAALPSRDGFYRNHTVGRTYTLKDEEARRHAAAIKLSVIKGTVEDQRIIATDDSVVRGTTLKQNAEKLYTAGAKEVHIRVAFPPIKNPCFYGMNMTREDGLIAENNTADETAAELGVDSLQYLSPERFEEAVGLAGKLCMACATGRYPEAVPGEVETIPAQV